MSINNFVTYKIMTIIITISIKDQVNLYRIFICNVIENFLCYSFKRSYSYNKTPRIPTEYFLILMFLKTVQIY